MQPPINLVTISKLNDDITEYLLLTFVESKLMPQEWRAHGSELWIYNHPKFREYHTTNLLKQLHYPDGEPITEIDHQVVTNLEVFDNAGAHTELYTIPGEPELYFFDRVHAADYRDEPQRRKYIKSNYSMLR
jgi:hypothetical protein